MSSPCSWLTTLIARLVRKARARGRAHAEVVPDASCELRLAARTQRAAPAQNARDSGKGHQCKVFSGPKGDDKTCLVETVTQYTCGAVTARVPAGAPEDKILADASSRPSCATSSARSTCAVARVACSDGTTSPLPRARDGRSREAAIPSVHICPNSACELERGEA
jgi:hypothetical protein